MFSIINKSCVAIVAVLCLIQPAMAATNVNVDVNPAASTGGVNADTTGVTATYHYTVYDGQSVNDTITVPICMTGSSSTTWTSINVAFGSGAGPLPGVTAPANETFNASAATPDCRNPSFTVATGTLSLANPAVSQNFNANFSLSGANPAPGTGANKPQVTFADIKNIHIVVTVLPSVSNVSCFLTNSEGNFLADCAGVPVTESGSSAARFAIVANKRQVEVATNPGQFYYNLVWHNTTGITQTVAANFVRTGVIPNGAQALHAAVFNGYLNPLTPTEFAQANANGIPDGYDDAVDGVTVPAGASLLVTYHLEWDGVGKNVPLDCAASCEMANQLMTVIGTVSGSGILTETCTATAYGYLKP